MTNGKSGVLLALVFLCFSGCASSKARWETYSIEWPCHVGEACFVPVIGFGTGVAVGCTKAENTSISEPAYCSFSCKTSSGEGCGFGALKLNEWSKTTAGGKTAVFCNGKLPTRCEVTFKWGGSTTVHTVMTAGSEKPTP
jgi:hypothetical protein